MVYEWECRCLRAEDGCPWKLQTVNKCFSASFGPLQLLSSVDATHFLWGESSSLNLLKTLFHTLHHKFSSWHLTWLNPDKLPHATPSSMCYQLTALHQHHLQPVGAWHLAKHFIYMVALSLLNNPMKHTLCDGSAHY